MEEIFKSYVEQFKELKSKSDKSKDYQTVYNCLATLMWLETNIYKINMEIEYRKIQEEEEAKARDEVLVWEIEPSHEESCECGDCLSK